MALRRLIPGEITTSQDEKAKRMRYENKIITLNASKLVDLNYDLNKMNQLIRAGRWVIVNGEEELSIRRKELMKIYGDDVFEKLERRELR